MRLMRFALSHLLKVSGSSPNSAERSERRKREVHTRRSARSAGRICMRRTVIIFIPPSLFLEKQITVIH